MREQVFEIPAPLWLSMNDRLHWRDKARRTAALRQMGARTHLQPQDRTLVLAYIGYPRAGRSDPGNAYPVLKALIDGMTDSGVWPDDDGTYVLGPCPLPAPSTKKRGLYRVRLVLHDALRPLDQLT